MGGQAFLAAVKIRTADLARDEEFFRRAVGFAVTHRYGNQAAGFVEVVMAAPDRPGLLLKFIQVAPDSPEADGVTIQLRSDDCRTTLSNALSCGASLVSPIETYPEAGVHMAVIETAGGLQIEIVEEFA